MEKFSYRVKDPAGIHARPAGIIVKEASKYNSDIKKPTPKKFLR